MKNNTSKIQYSSEAKISEFDFSEAWNNLSWTKSRIAIIPGRMQPPHAGHANLILNAAKRFNKIKILLYKRPIDFKNPFTLEERQTWLKRVLKNIGISEERVDIVWTEGLLSMEPEPRSEFLKKLTEKSKCAFISFNPDVINGCNKLSLDYIIPFGLSKEVTGANMVVFENNGTRLREKIEKGIPVDENELAPGLSITEIQSIYKKRFSK